jgi:hypothetical protein
MGLLGLEDDDFYDQPLADQAALSDRLFDQGFTGVGLDGPTTVDVERRATLPVVGARVATYEDMARVSFQRRAVLVATRLEANRTFAALATSPDELPPERPPAPRGDRPPTKGKGAVFALYDARARLGLPWRPGTYLLGLLLQDVASPRLRVTLTEPPSALGDPETARWVAEHRRVGFPEHVSPRLAPGEDLPRYRPQGDDPTPPAQPGLVLDATRVAVIGRPCVVRGALRLTPRRGEVVRPRPAADDPMGSSWQDVGEDEATAVVAVTLVVVSSERGAPSVHVLQVPSRDPLPDPAAPGEVTATFAVDLRTLGTFGRIETLFVYAFAGEHMAGPAPVGMISEEMLRER